MIVAFFVFCCSLLFWLAGEQMAFAGSLPRVIAHGCGTIQGETITNSKEALESAISNGYQYIELDLAFTSDGQIAMIHDWDSSGGYYLGLGKNQAISYAQYQQCKVRNQFTPLTLDILAEILQKHPQVSIITDTKEDNIALLTAIQKQKPQIVKQIIPQIYQYSEYDAVKKLGYSKVILTLYKMTGEKNGTRIADFVQNRSICAVTMSVDLAQTGLAKTLYKQGIPVYMHTVNSLPQTVAAMQAGAYGIYSDTLLPAEVTYPSWQYYLARSGNQNQQLFIELQQGQFKLQMRSCNGAGSVSYYMGEQLLGKGALNQELKLDLSNISTGIHRITAQICNGNGQLVSSKQYEIWKDQNCVLLVAPQCRYVLEQFHTLGDFSQALQQQPQAVQETAQHCFFAKLGSAVYYNNGRVGLYLSGNTLLPTIAADSSGNIYTPLYDTAIVLGASNVQMNNATKAMDITWQGKTYQAGISATTKYYRGKDSVLQTKVQLYRNRAMASGQLYQELTGRSMIQQDGYLILLPNGTTATESQQKQLLEVAYQLYQ